MNKKTFDITIVSPLNKEFNTQIFFNGNWVRENGLEFPSSACGVSYVNRKEKFIILIWQRNHYDTFQTLAHEIGHITLHGRGSKFRGGVVIQEIEAETVAKRACELLNIPFNPYFKVDKTVNFLDNYYKFKPKKIEPRMELIEQIAMRIYETLKDIKI